MREEARARIGVSLESALGAVIQETGGILVDQGWLRIRGSGSSKLPRVASPDQSWILVADDAVGGFFALHPPEGHVSYLAPDTLEWEPLGIGYSAWFRWALSDKLAVFYRDYRARGWEKRLQQLAPEQGFTIDPPPWAKGAAYSELYSMTFVMRDERRGKA